MLAKITPVFVVFFLTAIYSPAQLIFTTYYTAKGQQTKNPTEAHYYRVLEHPLDIKSPANVEEYYMKTNTLKMKGTYKNPSSRQFVGKKYDLYDNGYVKSQQTFSEDGQRIDTTFYYHRNGLLKMAYYYPYEQDAKQRVNVVDTMILVYQDSTGNILLRDGTGYAEIGDNKTIEKGNYVNHKREGEWVGYFESGKYSFVEKYENGQLISGVSTDSSKKTYPYDSSTVYVNPEYPNGVHSLRELVARDYIYPKEAITNKVKGTVRVSFVVNKDGRTANYVVEEDLGYGTGEAAIEAFRNAEKWSPGLVRGVPVRVKYTLPIRLNIP